MLNKKTVDDLTGLQGKKVLVRCDFNVPLKDGVIQNYNRIDGAIPTIKKLLDQGAKVIPVSYTHLKICGKKPTGHSGGGEDYHSGRNAGPDRRTGRRWRRISVILRKADYRACVLYRKGLAGSLRTQHPSASERNRPHHEHPHRRQGDGETVCCKTGFPYSGQHRRKHGSCLLYTSHLFKRTAQCRNAYCGIALYAAGLKDRRYGHGGKRRSAASHRRNHRRPQKETGHAQKNKMLRRNVI